MSTEIESLPTDPSVRRTSNGDRNPGWGVLAVIALVLALYAHWRFSQFDGRIERLRQRRAELSTTLDTLRAEVQSLTAREQESNAQLSEQIRALREVPTQVGELGQSVAELRARTEAPQRAWVRAEALYLLELAGRRLRLEHDVPTAVAAMESADARLATVTDPATGEVRAQLARELEALRAVNVPDVASIIARLTSLEARSPGLRVLGVPVTQPPRRGGAAGEGRREQEPPHGAFDRALRRLSQAWADLFSYRRVDPAASRLVTSEEESLRRQHLELLLFASRIAAMQQDQQAYQQSIRAAIDWLDRFFDVRDDAVATVRAELLELDAVDVDPARPQVGAAAQLLQRVIRSSANTAGSSSARADTSQAPR
jgi:uroporphyrin-3 C-methyltransferase